MYKRIEVTIKKSLLIFLVAALSALMGCYFSQPMIIFHTSFESGYLGKVSTNCGETHLLMVDGYTAKHRLPHSFFWTDDTEIVLLTRNYNDLLTKKEMDFWRLEIYLNPDGSYKTSIKKTYISWIDEIFCMTE